MFKLWVYLKLLLSYFAPGVEGEGEEGDEGAGGEGAEGGDGAEGDDEGAEGTEGGDEGAGEGAGAGEGGEGGEPPRQQSRAARDIQAQRDRAQRAEEERDRYRQEAENMRRANQGPTAAQKQWEEEEARLRAADVSDQEKWQIQANRTLRTTQQSAQNALNLAQDTNDKTAYESAAMANPTLAKYRDRVETEAAKLRAQGQPVSRLALARYLIGDDVASGRYQPKAKAAAKKPAGQLPESQRGTNARARSDVSGKNGKTESARRNARLENQLI